MIRGPRAMTRREIDQEQGLLQRPGDPSKFPVYKVLVAFSAALLLVSAGFICHRITRRRDYPDLPDVPENILVLPGEELNTSSTPAAAVIPAAAVSSQQDTEDGISLTPTGSDATEATPVPQPGVNATASSATTNATAPSATANVTANVTAAVSAQWEQDKAQAVAPKPKHHHRGHNMNPGGRGPRNPIITRPDGKAAAATGTQPGAGTNGTQVAKEQVPAATAAATTAATATTAAKEQPAAATAAKQEPAAATATKQEPAATTTAKEQPAATTDTKEAAAAADTEEAADTTTVKLEPAATTETKEAAAAVDTKEAAAATDSKEAATATDSKEAAAATDSKEAATATDSKEAATATDSKEAAAAAGTKEAAAATDSKEAAAAAGTKEAAAAPVETKEAAAAVDTKEATTAGTKKAAAADTKEAAAAPVGTKKAAAAAAAAAATTGATKAATTAAAATGTKEAATAEPKKAATTAGTKDAATTTTTATKDTAAATTATAVAATVEPKKAATGAAATAAATTATTAAAANATATNSTAATGDWAGVAAAVTAKKAAATTTTTSGASSTSSTSSTSGSTSTGSLKKTRKASKRKATWITCGDNTTMTFSVNGVQHKPSKLLDALTDFRGALGSLITLVANGTCGPFVGPTMKLYLRPHTATTNSTDIFVFRDLYLHHEFGFLDAELAKMDPKRIMDLGTNIGLSLAYWATHYPKAEVIGVEPELRNFGLAGLNVAHRPNVFLEHSAVTERVGFGKLKSMAEGDWAWGAEPTDNLSDAEGFTSVTIPYLMDKYGWETIDYLKVDIEGYEMEICQDIAKGAKWINKVKCITFEMHDRLRPLVTPTIKDTCHTAMKQAGLKFLGHHKVDHLYLWCH